MHRKERKEIKSRANTMFAPLPLSVGLLECSEGFKVVQNLQPHMSSLLGGTVKFK